MRKILLHIGPHKTGTTSFQQAIRNNWEELRKEGVYVPSPGKFVTPQGRVSLGSRAGGVHEVPKGIKAGSLSLLNAVISDFEKTDCHTLVLSSEGFDTFSVSDTRFLKDSISGYHVEVIAVFRHPLFLARSSFCSRGSGGTSRLRPGKYLNKFLEMGRVQYLEIIKAWRVFENFYLLKYEDSSDITAELFKFIGVKDNRDFSRGRLRKSLSPLETLVLQDIFIAFASDPALFRDKMYPVYLQFLEEVDVFHSNKHNNKYEMTPFSLDDQKLFLEKWSEMNFDDSLGFGRDKWGDYELLPGWDEVDLKEVAVVKNKFIEWLSDKIDVTVYRHF